MSLTIKDYKTGRYECLYLLSKFILVNTTVYHGWLISFHVLHIPASYELNSKNPQTNLIA